jgi:uncharacterized protein (TIGR02588 family)
MAKRSSSKTSATPPLEWVMAAIGFTLVASTIAFIAHDALTDAGAPPEITVRSDSISPLEHGYLVTLSASNRGDRTAAAVKVEGELRKGAVTVEKREMSFQYVPARSERKGGLFFTHDPRALELVITAHGYERP